jgi:hypothetical protein
MKTLILQLEKFDTLASTREKMQWAKTGRILLVWPKRGKPAFSVADIGSIQHEAHQLGVEVAFVCQDAFVEDTAASRNISVFHSVPIAERSRWQKSLKDPEKPPVKEYRDLAAKAPKKVKLPSNPGNRILRLVTVASAGLAIFALVVFSIPHATITLYPELTTKTIEINILASPDIDNVNINGNLPAKVQTIDLTKTSSGQSTGKAALPSQYATGEVTFANISSGPVTIPMGTIIASEIDPGIKFATLEEITLAAGETSDPVRVQADSAGAAGNVDAGVLTTIDGQLGLALQVTNDAPTSGGADVEAPSPTETDYVKLRVAMLTELRQEAMAQYPQGDTRLIGETLDEGTIVSETRSVDPGTAADTFSLTISVEFKGLTYSSAQLKQLVNETMAASLDQGTTIYGEGTTIANQTVATGDVNLGATWILTAMAETGQTIDSNLVIQKVTGKRISDARDFLNTMIQQRQEMDVSVFPRSWGWLPWLSLNIQVVVK